MINIILEKCKTNQNKLNKPSIKRQFGRFSFSSIISLGFMDVFEGYFERVVTSEMAPFNTIS